MAEELAVVVAARVVADAFNTHGEVMATVVENRDSSQAADASEVTAVIEAGRNLREAVLAYGRVLMTETGWSNPVRHLGRLPQHDSNTGGEVYKEDNHALRFRVTTNHVVAVDDEVLLSHLVEGRGLSAALPADAVRFLAESDGWDVLQYPPRRLRLLEAQVDVSVADE